MAPNTIHSKRRTDQLESPVRNRRCMDDRKNSIVDPQLRTRYADQTPSTGVFQTFRMVGSLAFKFVADSISSFAPPPPHNGGSQPASPRRSRPKPRRIAVGSSMDSLAVATQVPLPPSPPHSLPFQELGRHVETTSPSTKRHNGQLLSAAASPAQSFSGFNSPPSSRSPRRGSSTVYANGITKPYQPRKHIRHKQHKLEVQSRLQQELLQLRMASGQLRSVAEFDAYIKYAETINKIDAATESYFPVSKSLTFGHGTRTSTATPREVSDEKEFDYHSDFLQKAIKRANDTLKSTRIPNNLSEFLQSLSDINEPSAKLALPESLSTDDQAEVASALQKRGTVAKVAREQVSDKDLARLKPAQWLNDEIINIYGALLMARSEEAQKGKGKALDIHYFNTFFFAKLEDPGYEKARVGKWTKKIDIFKKDVVLIPVNLGNAHWTCAAINFKQKRIEYHDSMGRQRGKIYKHLRDYLEKEHMDKKKKSFDFTGWENYFDDKAPQQENGYDCGVFSCQYMECISRGADFNFSQSNMTYLRQRMILEIMRGKLWDQ